MALFDHVIESAKIGLRKPDPRIYRMMVEALGVDPAACVYLDDLGVNLKPAREMGMTTIKVVSGPQAIAELEAATGMTLGKSTCSVMRAGAIAPGNPRRSASEVQLSSSDGSGRPRQ